MFWRFSVGAFGAAGGLLAAGLLWAQPPSVGAPEAWPCVQRYQPAVSAGIFWPHELLENVDWADAREVRALADRITERAVTLEEAREEVRVFLATRDKNRQKTAGLLVTALDEFINSKRDRVIEGIARFSARQQKMIRRIQAQSKKIEELKALANPDAKELEDLSARQKWDVRVLEEREGLAGHLCEQPVLMEQKFFVVGRDIVAFLEEHDARP